MITVKFILISSLLVGRDAQSLELPAGSTIAHLLTIIKEKKSSSAGIDTVLRHSVFFVNQETVDKNTTLNDGDEVIITPVFG
jgi:molybdopterin converting factor small subunit